MYVSSVSVSGQIRPQEGRQEIVYLRDRHDPGDRCRHSQSDSDTGCRFGDTGRPDDEG